MCSIAVGAVDAVFYAAMCFICVLLTCAVAVGADALYADAVCVVAVGLALNA